MEAKQFELQRNSPAEQRGRRASNPEMEKIREEMRDARNQFIRKNPNSTLSLIFLAPSFGVSFGELEQLDEFEALFNTLGKKMRESERGQRIIGFIEWNRESIERRDILTPGNLAPAWTKKDKHGNSISLSDFLGQYVLLDFWGSWCGPCRASHPKLVQLHRKYSPLGLVFIHIAQENSRNAEENRANWLRAIEEDGLTWTQILNNEGREEYDVVRLYNIPGFPTKILIAPDGKIVAVWVGASPDLEEKLKEIFGV